MSQIALPFDWPADETRENFIVTSSNEDAVNQMEHWGSWPIPAALLVGPRMSGRSLLGRIFAAKTGGHLIDDAERKPETEIFHRWNLAMETRRPLLVVASVLPPEWRIGLPDLRSRLNATRHLVIGEPDEKLSAALIEKILARRGLTMAPDVMKYALARLPRLYHALIDFAERADYTAIAQQRGVTIPLVRQVLADMHKLEPDDGQVENLQPR
jgi:chromosomal replication initiation ATPase DnaA